MSNKSKHIGFRYPPEDLRLLKKICVARGENVSDFVRRATRKELARMNYLGHDEKKALGVGNE